MEEFETEPEHSVTIEVIDTRYKYGYHVNKKRSLAYTVQSVLDRPVTAFQVCIASPRGKAKPKLDMDVVDDILKTRELLYSHHKGLYMVVHGSLCYNLCGAVDHRDDPKFTTKVESTCNGLTGELDIGAALEIGIVVHIGSCKKKEKGMHTIAKIIENVLTRDSPESKILAKELKISVGKFKKRRMIILENAAGEGSKIGSILEDIGEIYSLLSKDLIPQVKVCIDTQHAFGAGLYHWGDPKEVRRFYTDFDKIIGLKHLEVFHLNDSRVPFNSHKDRHENLGLGYIFEDGDEGLIEFFKQARRRQIPIIGEPPKKSADGGDGPGGLQDWPYVCDLLEGTKYPLMTVM